MSLIEKSLDLAPASAARPFGIARFLAPVAATLRALRNRREIVELRDFSDAQLADIGLTRADVGSALARGRFDDPSDLLTAAAGHRRTVIRRP